MIADLAEHLRSIHQCMNIRYPDAKISGLHFETGREKAWEYLSQQHRCLKSWRNSNQLQTKYTAVATPADLFFHIRSAEFSRSVRTHVRDRDHRDDPDCDTR